MPVKTAAAFVISILVALGGCGDAEPNPFIAARADTWRSWIAADLPTGSDLPTVMAFFQSKGLSPRYVDSERTLYAPENIEPEPKSLLPFDSGLIKSHDIRCKFSTESKLVACSVEPSTTKWASGNGA